MKIKLTNTNTKPKKIRSRWANQSAFTIIEAAMASTVLFLAIASSITVVQRGFNAIDSSRNFVIAGQIMQSEIEKMRMSPWTSTATITGIADYTNTFPTVAIDGAIFNPEGRNFTFTLTRTMGDPLADLRTITLTITWTNFDGRQMTRSYMTEYARYGLYDFFSS